MYKKCLRSSHNLLSGIYVSTNSKGGVLGLQRWLSFIIGPKNFLSEFFEGWVESDLAVEPVESVEFSFQLSAKKSAIYNRFYPG